MTGETRNAPAEGATSVMPWTSAWRYAVSRVAAPRSWRYWAGSLVGITLIELVATDWSLPRAILSAVVFVLVMEVLEFVRRFLSGAPVGEAGKEPW
ncbi:hypothetical protein Strain138_001664 [Pseudogemmatithrix spongiicola]|uniref:Uncharacterized protein n=1 Tax=Pseudogemmatithrix spongiicola TaxID=3062599 RepID=A0AA49JUY3_9BACT|nr:hypothetical protein Strain138_001664 [Gemmatimonadaceae bacterium 'strain 138']WKW15286.1 hypothetical protein Strain318_001663 [Gemmatimonadaceae bacterium 'strain 318']